MRLLKFFQYMQHAYFIRNVGTIVVDCFKIYGPPVYLTLPLHLYPLQRRTILCRMLNVCWEKGFIKLFLGWEWCIMGITSAQFECHRYWPVCVYLTLPLHLYPLQRITILCRMLNVCWVAVRCTVLCEWKSHHLRIHIDLFVHFSWVFW
jgi:hypothetical protein